MDAIVHGRSAGREADCSRDASKGACECRVHPDREGPRRAGRPGQGVYSRGANRLFHVKGRFYALDDYCPHMGESLSIGEVHGDAVSAPRHLWAFRLADGVCLDVPSLAAGTFEVRVEGDDVLVRIAEEA